MPAEATEPVVILPKLWQRPEMLTALRNRNIGQLFRLIRQYTGFSQTRIGVAVNLSQGKVSEIMKGAAQVTSFEVFERIAEGLRMPDSARMALGLAPTWPAAPRVIDAVPHPASVIPSRDGTPTSALLSLESAVAVGQPQGADPWDVDVLTLAWIVGRLDAHVDRRTMLILAAGMTAETAATIADPWERLSRALTGPQALDEDTIERLEARTIGFHRLEYVLPARAIYQGLTTHINELSNLLQSGPPDRFRRRLAATAGEAATLASWIAWDLKQVGQSASFERVSALAAKESGHPIIQACTYAYRSYAVEGHDAHEAVRQAQQFLPAQGDDATRAWLLSREAEELAALGDRRAIDLLHQAEEAYGRARPHRERAWTRFLDPGRMAAFQLSTYVRLGDERRVIEAGQAALSAVAQDADHKKVAVIYADIAQAQLQIGDVAEGVAYARRALDAVQRGESTWGLQHLTTVEKALATQQDQAARELLGDIVSTRRSLGPSPA
ncbi:MULTISPECIES: helix-turn-helix domain-containing protein [Streptosporangium]|uniref:Transcriptional regulator with XRE-family HTH domain n=1 Tax=Streptosporangium brasiliense TaxID=47480 RepID=A0ABT9RCC1_9ACTN|nr:helix-turn-helix domain-containing protein [Streptosporangium brasiliense]MDP9866035.1 transcriptional regulator with XRE-family HTH domain [Streptosporangium brasiliense]